jgi:hypothetical protein
LSSGILIVITDALNILLTTKELFRKSLKLQIISDVNESTESYSESTKKSPSCVNVIIPSLLSILSTVFSSPISSYVAHEYYQCIDSLVWYLFVNNHLQSICHGLRFELVQTNQQSDDHMNEFFHKYSFVLSSIEFIGSACFSIRYIFLIIIYYK